MILAIIAFVLLIALGGMWALASYEGARAQALQAQALITANQTAQISVIGQTILSLVLVALILTILGGVLVGLLMFKRWQTQAGQIWVSGPNARWQKSGQLPNQRNPAVEMSPQAQLLQQQMMQQQILTMWLMHQMGKPSEIVSLPEPQHPEIGNDLSWWE
jgi:hypothetical protein